MDLLRRSLAPIADKAWDEIDEQSIEIFSSVLSARKFVDVDGPKGWDYGSVSKGRLDIPKGQKGSLKYGIHEVQPLVEPRVNFKLDVWELDNAERGNEDVDLGNLEDAANAIAEFEEQTIFYGMNKAGIKGLKASSEHEKLKFSGENSELLKVIAQGLSMFKKAGVEGPYSLIVNKEQWQKLASDIDSGYPLKKQVEKLLEGRIIFSPHIKDAFLVSQRGGDFRLTLGRDLSVGYDYHEVKNVNLYFTESFTFEVLDPAAVIVLE
jgi:uncharacterized linocin/CFP29 family protein